jgi:hypothetical protein
MNVQAKEIRVRLLLSIGFVAVLSSVYVHALAVASVSGTFGGVVRPWQNIQTDFLLLGLTTSSLVCLGPVIRSDNWTSRILGLLLAAVPLLVLGHFITWFILNYPN